MSETAAPLSFEQLPRRLPIFPLSGALLLPGCRLPLHIFEPRYLKMVDDARRGEGVIGMIQPRQTDSTEAKPETFEIGCAGQISEFQTIEGGRYLITLTGLCRFSVVEELPAVTPYRQVLATYARFRSDFERASGDGIDRQRLLLALRAFLGTRNIDADWSAIEETPTGTLVDEVAMVSPFTASEKQALLESKWGAERAGVMTALLEMAALGDEAGDEHPMQ